MTQPLIKTPQIEDLSTLVQLIVAADVNLSDLSNVTLSAAARGDFLVFLGSPEEWVNTSTISLQDNRVVISGVSSLGSPSTNNNSTLELSSTLPGLMFNDTDGPVNEKVWRFIVTDGDLVGEMRSDSGTSGNRWLEVIRDGILASELSLFVGAEQKAIRALDGGAVQLHHNNINVAETTTSGAGGLRVNNTLTGAGFERVLTLSDIGGDGGGTVVVAGQALFFTGSPETILNVGAGDGLQIIGSPKSIAVDSTVARISTGSPGIVNTGTLIVDTIDLGARSTITTFETTTTSVSQAVIASYPVATYRSAELLIEAIQGDNYHVTKILTTHNGINAVSTEYGTVATPEFFGSPLLGSPAISGEQATFTVDVNGGNLRLLATPVTTASTVFTTTAILIKTKA